MAFKWQNDLLLDELGLQGLADNATELIVCSDNLTNPPTFTEVTVTYALADVAITSGDFTGPANGDTSGRKITVDQQTNVSVDTGGSAAQLVLVGTSSSPDLSSDTVLYVTTCNVAVLAGGQQWTIPAWDVELGDVT